MAAAPQFDLFAGAKGFEYARDQNTQDTDNALKQQQNQMSLDAFERQLKEYDKGAELRDLTRQNQTAQAKGRGGMLQDQLDFRRAMAAARASLTPAQLADTSARGYLDRVSAIQLNLQANKANPATIEMFGKEIGNAKAAALSYAQYDPEELNGVLQHPLFGAKYMVSPVAGKDGQFQVMKQGAPDGDGYRPYYPIPYSQGNLSTVAASLGSTFPNAGGPDRGMKLALGFDNNEFNRARLNGADVRAGQKVQLDGTAKLLADARAGQRISMTGQNSERRAQVEVAKAQFRAHNAQGVTLQAEKAKLVAAIAKLTQTGDLNAVNMLKTELDTVNQRILVHAAQGTQAPWQQVFAPPAAPVAPPVVESYAPTNAPTDGEDDELFQDYIDG